MAKGFGKFWRKVEGREHDTVSTQEEAGPWIDGWYERVVEHARRISISCPSRESILDPQFSIDYSWRWWLAREVGLRSEPASAVESLVSAEQERVNTPSEQQEGVQVTSSGTGYFFVSFDDYPNGEPVCTTTMATSITARNTRSR